MFLSEIEFRNGYLPTYLHPVRRTYRTKPTSSSLARTVVYSIWSSLLEGSSSTSSCLVHAKLSKESLQT